MTWRWIPHPVLALALLAIWLLLNQSLSPGHLLLGALVAIVATYGMVALRPEKPGIRSWRALARLAGIVAVDIARSNIAVGRIILFPRASRVSGFVRMQLAMRNQYGLAALACIITATPGTIWVQFDRGSGMLVIHALDLIDDEAWVQLIKGRYEALLIEVFGS